MDIEQAIAELDSINGSDPEVAHAAADGVLLAVVSQELRDAYGRVLDRSDGWWFA
jgi:hypothetical protein